MMKNIRNQRKNTIFSIPSIEATSFSSIFFVGLGECARMCNSAIYLLYVLLSNYLIVSIKN